MLAHQILITFASSAFFLSIMLMIQSDDYSFSNNVYIYGMKSDYSGQVGKGSACDGITSCIETMCLTYENTDAAHIVFDPMREKMTCGITPISSEFFRDNPWGTFLFCVSIILLLIMTIQLASSLKINYRVYSFAIYSARTISIIASLILLFLSLFNFGPHVLSIRSWPFCLHAIFASLAFAADMHAKKLTRRLFYDEILM
nr:hypothetical protein K-LCC10_0351 [Kaumoebavirus]